MNTKGNFKKKSDLLKCLKCIDTTGNKTTNLYKGNKLVDHIQFVYFNVFRFFSTKYTQDEGLI